MVGSLWQDFSMVYINKVCGCLLSKVFVPEPFGYWLWPGASKIELSVTGKMKMRYVVILQLDVAIKTLHQRRHFPSVFAMLLALKV